MVRHRIVPVAAVLAAASLTLVLLGPGTDAVAAPTQATVDPTLFVTTTEPPLGRGTISVTPSTGLVDGQEVAVSVVGFEPDEELGLIQCAPDPRPDYLYACLEYHDLAADGAGELHTSFAVARTFHDDETDTDVDCSVAVCFLGSGIPSGAFPDIHAEIAFAPVAATPATPLPRSPDFTG